MTNDSLKITDYNDAGIILANCDPSCVSGICIADDECRCDEGHYGIYCEKGNTGEDFLQIIFPNIIILVEKYFVSWFLEHKRNVTEHFIYQIISCMKVVWKWMFFFIYFFFVSSAQQKQKHSTCVRRRNL